MYMYAHVTELFKYSTTIANTGILLVCRREHWSKLLQNVHFYPNTHYVFSAMVKLVNQSDAVVGENIDLVWYYEGEFENSKCGYARTSVVSSVQTTEWKCTTTLRR